MIGRRIETILYEKFCCPACFLHTDDRCWGTMSESRQRIHCICNNPNCRNTWMAELLPMEVRVYEQQEDDAAEEEELIQSFTAWLNHPETQAKLRLGGR